MLFRCRACGVDLPRGDTFCWWCGSTALERRPGSALYVIRATIYAILFAGVLGAVFFGTFRFTSEVLRWLSARVN